jgi:hypothetical protein
MPLLVEKDAEDFGHSSDSLQVGLNSLWRVLVQWQARCSDGLPIHFVVYLDEGKGTWMMSDWYATRLANLQQERSKSLHLFEMGMELGFGLVNESAHSMEGLEGSLETEEAALEPCRPRTGYSRQ